jgi:hypothetical protein
VIEQQINIDTQNVQNNLTFNINVFGSTASSLTPEVIRQRVLDAISCEAVEKGLASMTEEVAPHVFTNEKKNWLLRTADASRNKLIIRMDHGDKPDIQGHNTTRLLRTPFMEATMLALEQSDKPRDVEDTIEEIKDRETYDKKTMGALLRMVPTKFDTTDPQIFTEAHRLAEEEWTIKLDKVMAKRAKLKAKKKASEARKWCNELLDSQDLHDGTFWHPTHQYVIRLDEEREFVIIGKREDRSHGLIKLTQGDLAKIDTMGLVDKLDEQYRVKLAAPV